MVTASVLPMALSPRRLRQERDDARRSTASSPTAADVERSFPAPAPGPPGAGPAGQPDPAARPGRHGGAAQLREPVRGREPGDARALRRRTSRNRIARAQHWRHTDGEGPRPTLCVIHGFTASPYWVNSAFFSLPWFFHNGYDVLLYTLPFHGRRQSRTSPYSGHGYFAHGFANLNEAMAHARARLPGLRRPPPRARARRRSASPACRSAATRARCSARWRTGSRWSSRTRRSPTSRR